MANLDPRYALRSGHCMTVRAIQAIPRYGDSKGPSSEFGSNGHKFNVFQFFDKIKSSPDVVRYHE